MPGAVDIGKYRRDGRMAASREHDVRAVTEPPYYPSWRIDPLYSSRRYRRERLSGVTVFHCLLWAPSKPGAFTRLLHFASFTLSSLPVMMRQVFWKLDVVFQ